MSESESELQDSAPKKEFKLEGTSNENIILAFWYIVVNYLCLKSSHLRGVLNELPT